jgi:hypothetical protein
MRIRQLESKLREDDDEQAREIERLRGERNMARDEAAEFNEQKRCESQVQCLSSEVQRANQAMDKMRTEAVSMRSKLADLGGPTSSDNLRLQRLGVNPHWQNVSPRS